MPIYEYQCDACGKISEAWQKITEEPLKDCADCGATGSLHRLISNTAFVLKGTGWYVTDFRDKSKPSSSPAPKAESEPSAPASCSSGCCASSTASSTEHASSDPASTSASGSESTTASNNSRAAASKTT